MLRLIGRIDSQHVRDLKDQLANETRTIVLDLSENEARQPGLRTLLAAQRRQGIELRNCPAYIREWISGDRRAGDESE